MSTQHELSLDKLPLHPVTAVLFTYNQEEYVRYAFEDLMGQDIDMMTVIISDDCSTDRTFQIIQELVQATNSRFDIRARQNESRLGFNNHINKVAAEFSPEVMIPFAGDDRFYPSRARMLSDTQKRTSALLVHSGCSFITETGQPRTSIHRDATFYHTTDPFSAARSSGLFIGATAAWSRELFTRYGDLPRSPYEDLVLGFRATLTQRIQYVPEELMAYRVGVGQSVSKKSSRAKYFHQKRYVLHAHRQACLKHKGKFKKLIEMIDHKLFELRLRDAFLKSSKRVRLMRKKKPLLSLCFLADELIRKIKQTCFRKDDRDIQTGSHF